MSFLFWSSDKVKKSNPPTPHSGGLVGSNIITLEDVKKKTRLGQFLLCENFRKILILALERNYVYSNEMERKVKRMNWVWYFRELIKFDILVPTPLRKEIAHFIKKQNCRIGDCQLNQMKIYTLSAEIRSYLQISDVYEFLQRNIGEDFLNIIEEEKVQFFIINNDRKLKAEQKENYKKNLLQLDFKSILRQSGYIGSLQHLEINNAYDFKKTSLKDICYNSGLTKDTLERINRTIDRRLKRFNEVKT